MFKQDKQGSMLVLVIIATSLFLVILLGSISIALLQRKLNIKKIARAQAIHVAEAGVNYYRWLLYHEQEEYCNNEACIGGPDYGPYGPYAYTDSAGDGIVGYYELYITPPALNGSTIVKIKSVGWIADHPATKRSIEVLCGIPSWTTYATMTNGADWATAGVFSYGSSAEVWGPVHSNYSCIRNQGTAHNIFTSSQTNCNNKWGVYNDADPNFPTPITPPELPNFLGGRDYGPHIPIVSFSASVGSEFMNSVYAKATSSDGLLFDPANAGSAEIGSEAAYWGCDSAGLCDEGFHITFIADNKFRISMLSSISGNYEINGAGESATVEYDIPANSIIFVKQSVWVDGQFNNGASGTRATVLAFKDPIDGANDANIIINDNMLYSNYDGADALGLIAQQHVSFSEDCSNDVRVDAALLAKTGRRYAPNFVPNKNSATIYGNTASFLKPSMSSGFNNRYYIYDNNLTFAPPPHYPSTGQYTFISWKEE